MGIEFNNNRLEKTSRFVNYLIATILCGFLIALSGKLIGDMDDYTSKPQVEQFEDLELVNRTNKEIEIVDVEIEQVRLKRNKIQNEVSIAKNNYTNAKESFENWLKARKTIGSSSEDKEVLTRAKKLDEYYDVQQKREKELNEINKESKRLFSKRRELKKVIDDDREEAYGKLEVAMRAFETKVFLKRLLFVLPILLLGIYFVMKFRKHKYWPLFLGYVMFSLYAFFFGLVPYLPSYGGYVRSAVGVVLSVLMGIYIINKIKAFIERKKEELKESTTERAKNVKLETAEKALDNHMCPSCGKDFIIKQWAVSMPQDAKKRNYTGVTTDFCRFCGLELFKECEKCGTKNFAHLPYCSCCGTKVTLNS